MNYSQKRKQYNNTLSEKAPSIAVPNLSLT